jgi:hypothetical protein
LAPRGNGRDDVILLVRLNPVHHGIAGRRLVELAVMQPHGLGSAAEAMADLSERTPASSARLIAVPRRLSLSRSRRVGRCVALNGQGSPGVAPRASPDRSIAGSSCGDSSTLGLSAGSIGDRVIDATRLILPDDLRRGRDDVAFAVGDQEEAVRDPWPR